MKLKIKTLFVFVAIALFLLGGYYYYEHRQSAIEQIAKEAFVNAVDEEAYKRIPNMDVTIGFNGGKLLSEGEAPSFIMWHDKSGQRKYKIDSEKYWKNVTMDSDVQLLHSCAFEESPVNLDSLNLSWQHLLKKKDLICRTGICIFSTDLDEKTSSLLTSDSGWLQNQQPFWDPTIGYRCEMHCFLYLQYSLWQVLGFAGIAYTLLYLFSIFAIYKVAAIIRRRMNPGKIIIEKEVEVEVEVEVLVKDVKSTATRLYNLGTNVNFDAEKRIISEGEKQVTLTNQSAELLELFLQGDDYTLSVNAISEKLWKAKGNYENRVYQTINRLRVCLKEFPSLSIDTVSVGNYQLKIR